MPMVGTNDDVMEEMMMTTNEPREGNALMKLSVAGSLISAVVLFALSMAAVIAVGCVLGGMVLVERLARECNSEECQNDPARIETDSRAAIAR